MLKILLLCQSGSIMLKRAHCLSLVFVEEVLQKCNNAHFNWLCASCMAYVHLCLKSGIVHDPL